METDMSEKKLSKVNPGDFLNPERRCPCVLLLDTSGSMDGAPLDELNQGLQTLHQQLNGDPLARKRAEVGIITFGPVKVRQALANVDTFKMPTLAADNDTPLGAAVMAGVQMVADRKLALRKSGIDFYRPWIFLITDGGPTDDCKAAIKAVKDGETSNAFSFFPIGVEGADMGFLGQLGTRTPLKLKGLQFNTLFEWLSKSMSGYSRSEPGKPFKPENPAGPKGWAEM